MSATFVKTKQGVWINAAFIVEIDPRNCAAVAFDGGRYVHLPPDWCARENVRVVGNDVPIDPDTGVLKP